MCERQKGLIAMPKVGKKGKPKATNALVLESLTPSLPIVLPEAAAALEANRHKSSSAPSSPSRDEKGGKHGKGKGKYLQRPNSPRMPRKPLDSPPDTGQGSQGRPKWLALGFRKKRSKSTSAMNNGDITPTSPSPMFTSGDRDLNSTSGSSIEPEATPVAMLPGQEGRTLDSEIPEIMVTSHIGDGEVGVNGLEGEMYIRKFSQSSHHSRCSTLHSNSGTSSGVGSLLSPSGDEGEIGSDLESPLSPLSGASFRGSTDDLHGDSSDNDCIEKDLTSALATSPTSDSDTLGVTTPPPCREYSPTGGDSGSEMSGKEGATYGKGKKKRDRPSKPWDKVRRVMQAWSPFALQFKKRKYPWVQLAGHQGNFSPGTDSGTIMKKSDQNESRALQALMMDELRPFVPEFRRVIERDSDIFVEMTDLLREYEEPAVMDIKMGVRTYLEDELTKARTKKVLRQDMYEKMIKINPNEPTEEEHAQHAISKPRYMQWRETISSSSSLGFRIEGIKTTSGKALKDFQQTKAKEDVIKSLQKFLWEHSVLKELFLRRLLDIRKALERSDFFRTHEVIGSSLLFVYDSSNQCSIHIIDFGKTVALPVGVVIDHRSTWEEGNHEDGYLWGLDNLIQIWESLR